MKVAMVAHDAKKADMVQLARRHLDLLSQLELVATGTTGLLVAGVGLDVERVNSGPAGGDLQIGALIASGEIDAVIFLRDPLSAHPHEPDINALLKVCDTHDVPLATNIASAELMLASMRANRKASQVA